MIAWADLTELLATDLTEVEDEGWRYTGVFDSRLKPVPGDGRIDDDADAEAVDAEAVDTEADGEDAEAEVNADNGIIFLCTRPSSLADLPGANSDTDTRSEDTPEDEPDQMVARFLNDLDSFMVQAGTPPATSAFTGEPDPAELHPAEPAEEETTVSFVLEPSDYFDMTLPAGAVALLHSTMNNPGYLPLLLAHGTPPVDPAPTITFTPDQNIIQVQTRLLDIDTTLNGQVHPGYLNVLPDLDFNSEAANPYTLQAQHVLFGFLAGCALGRPTDLIRLTSLAAWVTAEFNATPDTVIDALVDAGVRPVIVDTSPNNTSDTSGHTLTDGALTDSTPDGSNTSLCLAIFDLFDAALTESRDVTRNSRKTINPFEESPLPATLTQPWVDLANPKVLADLNQGADLAELLDGYAADDVIIAIGVYLAAMCALYVHPIPENAHDLNDRDGTLTRSLIMLNWLTPNNNFHHWWGLPALTPQVEGFDTNVLIDLLNLVEDPDEPTQSAIVLPHYLHELAGAIDALGWNAATLTAALNRNEITPPNLEDAIEIGAMLAPPHPSDPQPDYDDDQCPHHARAQNLADRATDHTRLVHGAATLLPLLADVTATGRGFTPDDDNWRPNRLQLINIVLSKTAEMVTHHTLHDDDDDANA